MNATVDQIRQEFDKKAFGQQVMFGAFFEHPIKDEAASRNAGFPVFRSRVFVRIKTKGRQDTTARLATDEDKEVFSTAWEKFSRVATEGHRTPLQSLPFYTTNLGETLKALGINDAEELAQYDGELPRCYELLAMKDAAECLMRFWMQYEPLEKTDGKGKIPDYHDCGRPQNGSQIRAGAGQPVPGGNQAAENIRVIRDGNGNVVGVEHEEDREKTQHEKALEALQVSQPQEMRPPPAPEPVDVSAYLQAQFEPPTDPLEGLAG